MDLKFRCEKFAVKLGKVQIIAKRDKEDLKSSYPQRSLKRVGISAFRDNFVHRGNRARNQFKFFESILPIQQQMLDSDHLLA